MSVYQVVLGSAWIVLGSVTGARSVVALTWGRTEPEMSGPGPRASKWRQLGGSVMSCLLGIVFVTGSLHNDTARWLLGTIATALLIWYLGSESGSWHQARRQRRSARTRRT
jgi:hypothetical protein